MGLIFIFLGDLQFSLSLSIWLVKSLSNQIQLQKGDSQRIASSVLFVVITVTSNKTSRPAGRYHIPLEPVYCKK